MRTLIGIIVFTIVATAAVAGLVFFTGARWNV